MGEKFLKMSMKNYFKHMENKNISKLAMDSINKMAIKPQPKIRFVIKKVIIWLFAILSVLIGSLSFAVTLYLLFDYDLNAFQHLGINMIFHFLPYFWFLFLGVFIIVGEYYYRKTTLGYRYRLALVLIIYIIITLAVGSMGYAAGLGATIENELAKNMPFYQKYLFNKESIWSQPENGLLSGAIKSVSGKKIILVDFKNDNWEINIEGALIRGRAVIKAGEKIKIIGIKTGNGFFKAQEIRPWQGGQGMGQGRIIKGTLK